MKKKFTVLTLILAMALSAGIGAFAASNNETISALLNREITVNYNGVKQSFTDASGKTVYPISYNGSTYLPVRAVSGLLGLPISYDAPTDTINMGAVEKQPTSLVTVKNSGGTDFSWVISDQDQLKFAGSDATHTFKNGVLWHQWNSSMSMGNDRAIFFEVGGYSTVTFTAAADVRAEVRLYDQNNKVISSFTLLPGEMATKTISLNGATKLAFASDYPNLMLVEGDSTDVGYLYIYEPTLS